METEATWVGSGIYFYNYPDFNAIQVRRQDYNSQERYILGIPQDRTDLKKKEENKDYMKPDSTTMFRVTYVSQAHETHTIPVSLKPHKIQRGGGEGPMPIS